MLQLHNNLASLLCSEDGTNIEIVDTKRGTHWILDTESLRYSDSTEQNLLPLIPVSANLGKDNSLRVTYQAGEINVDFIYKIKDSYIEVLLPAVASSLIQCITLPGSFSPRREGCKLLMPIMQGMLWDGRGPEFAHIKGEGSHSGFSMAFTGFLAERSGLLITAETRDDCKWWYGKDIRNRKWVANIQIASLGSIRYERMVRLYVTDPDIVAITRQYRRKVIEQGLLINWDEKIAQRPAVERIFGALMGYIGYCEDEVDYLDSCRKLKAYGFDRVLLYPGRFNIYDPNILMGGVPSVNLSTTTIEAIKSLGYDIAPWSWLNEALQSSPEEVKHLYRRNKDGQIIPHWKIDDQQWFLMCHSYLPEYQRRAISEVIPEMTWDHFDVLACVPPMECYALDHLRHLGHPAPRSLDRQWIRETFTVDQEAGWIVSSENFNDAYAQSYDIGSVKALPQYGPWPFWPIPLTMLVYHDSLVHSWWEVHSYNNPWRGRTSMLQNLFAYGGGRSRLMAAMDALMGCPPDVFAFGAQYGYTGHGTDTFLYKYRFEDPEVQVALKAALPVSQLHRRIGRQEMVHFKILSEDGYVQETAFADGTHVVANFSLDFVGEIPGIDHKVIADIGNIQPEGWSVIK